MLARAPLVIPNTDAASEQEENSQFPFFIVGCGRSGTSLLRGLLTAHPEIAIPLESLFVVDYLRVRRNIPLAELKRMLTREPEIREWGFNLPWYQIRDSKTIGQALGKLFAAYAEWKGKHRWGQKTPRFVRHMELLAEHFPNSRFIHVVRDPRAVVSSLIRSDVHRSNAYFAAKRWKLDVESGVGYEDTNPERVFRVHFENLAKDPEKALRSISSFLNIEYDPDTISRAASGAGEYSRFYEHIHANLDQSLSPSVANHWEERLSSGQVEVVEAIAGKLMRQLGYSPLTNTAKLHSAPIWRMKAGRAIGLLRQVWRYMRLRPRYLYHLIWRKWKFGLLSEFIRGASL